MSTLLANRVHSAYHRPNRRSSSNIQVSTIKLRPITSMTTRRSHTDVYELPVWRTLAPSTPSGTRSNRRRPKTSSISSSTNEPFSMVNLQPNEIESLLRSLKRDDKFIVQVDCLADYRKLVQTINLRQTPVDHKSLCALQQRENRIVQQNACRDTRFHSLLGTLQPAHITKVEENNSNDGKLNNVSEYQADDDDIDD